MHHAAAAVRRNRRDDELGVRRARRASASVTDDAVGQTRRPAGRRRSRGAPPCRRRARRSRAHSRTSWPTRPRCTASAVPQLPAPSTATRPHHAAHSEPPFGAGAQPHDVRAVPEDDEDRRGDAPRATAGAGLPSAYASGGSASDARPSRARCTWSATRPRDEDRERRRNGQRRQDGEDAARGRHAFAAAEPQPDRIDVPDDRGEPGGRRHRRAGAQPRGQPARSPRPSPCRARRRARRR